MAYAGSTIAATASQFSTLQLFNNSQYAELLLVRDWVLGSSGTNTWVLNVGQTNLGLTTVPVNPVNPLDIVPPGLVTSGATATQITTGYQLRGFAAPGLNWYHDFPFAILPANWYFTMQVQNVNILETISVYWEAITPDQLNEDAWLARNLELAQGNG